MIIIFHLIQQLNLNYALHTYSFGADPQNIGIIGSSIIRTFNFESDLDLESKTRRQTNDN